MKTGSDPVMMSGNIVAMGGSDEKGLFMRWGPLTREIYAIMLWRLNEETNKYDWVPYKMFKNTKRKTQQHARRQLLDLRREYSGMLRFRLQIIWEVVPVEEMQKEYYETKDQIIEEFGKRLGRPRGEFVLGFGRSSDTGPVGNEKLEQILTGVGESGTEIRAYPIVGSNNEPG